MQYNWCAEGCGIAGRSVAQGMAQCGASSLEREGNVNALVQPAVADARAQLSRRSEFDHLLNLVQCKLRWLPW